MQHARTALRLAALFAAALALAGCVVVPGPRYYHPYRGYYHDWR